MCTISNIGDQWQKQYPYDYEKITTTPTTTYTFYPVSREEFDKLKKDFENLKKLLRLAKIIDEQTGQPDCEMDEKVAFLKQMAEWLNIDLEDIL